MPTQRELDKAYMQVAESHASMSKGQRAKVGACLVTPLGIMLPGYNGLPSALGNVLEEVDHNGFVVSKKEVIHAELNCILKAARQGVSVAGSKIYLTLSPCQHCASMLLSVGIEEVIYAEPYRLDEGLKVLQAAGCFVRQIEEN